MKSITSGDGISGLNMLGQYQPDFLQRVPLADLVTKYFAGDAEFFAKYQNACLAQFPNDLSDGHAACAALDMATLMRTAHNLKSVLLTLGYTSISQDAAICEQCCQTEPVQRAVESWSRLAEQLTAVWSSGDLQAKPGD